MNTFADLVQLARICLRQARISRTPEVAHAFRQMAQEYKEKAANLNDGQAPDMDGAAPGPRAQSGGGPLIQDHVTQLCENFRTQCACFRCTAFGRAIYLFDSRDEDGLN